MWKICKIFLKLKNYQKLVAFELFIIRKQSKNFNVKPDNSFLFYAVDPQNLTEIAILTRTLQMKFWKLNKDFESIHWIAYAHQYYA